jgi:hypothetical protein
MAFGASGVDCTKSRRAASGGLPVYFADAHDESQAFPN